MRILHLSTYDSIGGAAIATYRLNAALNKQEGVESKILVSRKTIVDSTIINDGGVLSSQILVWGGKICAKLKKLMLGNKYVFSLGFGRGVLNKNLIEWAEVIYIHWTGNSYLGIRDIRKLLDTKKPVILYMHDMYYFTGGCHHSFNCNGYQQECQNCPLISVRLSKWMAHCQLERKGILLAPYSNLSFMAPSNWLAGCFQESRIFKGKKIEVIPNVLDTEIYAPIDKKEARVNLKLPLGKKLVCFGAASGTSDPYKGWNILLEAVRHLDALEFDIVLFGGKLSLQEKEKLNCTVHELGYIRDSQIVRNMYSACDVFVTPSLAENYPLTLMESIACGCPVVGFNVGGIPDLIKHKETGYLATYMDEHDLAEGIRWVLLDMQQRRMDLHAFAKKNYSEEIVVSRHLESIAWSNEEYSTEKEIS